MKRFSLAAILPAAMFVCAPACVSTAQSVIASHSGTVPRGTILVAELAKSLDARKVKTGDPIKAKVVQDVVSNGQIVIPRGCKLLGHISEVRASGQEEPRSALGVVFDKVALKHGEELRFNAVLQAIAPPAPRPDPLGSSSYDGSRSVGVRQPPTSPDGGWVIDPRELRDHTREDALRNASNPNSYGSNSNTLHGGFLGSGNRGVFGMPGISLKPVAPATEIVSTQADIKLEDGTQMVLGIL